VLSLFPYPRELNGGSYGLTQNLKSGITGFRTLSRTLGRLRWFWLDRKQYSSVSVPSRGDWGAYNMRRPFKVQRPGMFPSPPEVNGDSYQLT